MIVALLVAVIIPEQAGRKVRSERMVGVSNLKQIGLAFRLFSTDHGDRLPMEIPKEEGGVKEIFDKGQVKRIYRTFLTMSNDLGNTPRMVTDPGDRDTQSGFAFSARAAAKANQTLVLFDGNVHTPFCVGPDASDKRFFCRIVNMLSLLTAIAPGVFVCRLGYQNTAA